MVADLNEKSSFLARRFQGGVERGMPARNCHQAAGRGRSCFKCSSRSSRRELGISRSLVYRLVARYRRRAQTSSLLSVPRGRPKRSRSLDERVEALVRSAVERIYLQREQPRVSDLLRIIKIDCQRLGLKPPAYNTLHARLRSLDPREVIHYHPIGHKNSSCALGLEPIYGRLFAESV